MTTARILRWLAALAWAGVAAAAAHAAELPSFEAFKARHATSDVVLEDREGRPIAARRTDDKVRRLAWVTLDDISPALIEALLAAEDKRFYRHHGVDWVAAASVLWDHAKGSGGKRGASTLSMQVAAMLDPALARGAAPRDLRRKWDQAEAALALEKSWSKAQILEAYLNTVTFRGELLGVRAASQGLFGKAPSGLDKRDSALLAALIRSPGAKPEVAARRACGVLAITRPDGGPCDTGMLATQLRQASLQPQAAPALAPHAGRKLLAAGTPARSSLDAGIQRMANEALAAQIALLAGRGVEDGAAVVLDNRSGQVLAYVGSSGSFSRAAQVDAADAPRQAGSTLKPFLYALAFERQLLTPATVLDDSPIAVATDAGVYAPRNYDLRYLGPVSVRRALGSSLNVPAVRAIGLTGAAPLHHMLRDLGLATLNAEAEHYGDSLALGAADVSLLQLTNAYRALANGGESSPPRWTPEEAAVRPRRVLGAGSAWLVTHILADNAAREGTFGFDSVLATPFWTAVKTGTSKDMRDNWCVGFSEHFTVGVWVGNAGGAPMRSVSGVSGAAPAWAEIMRELHRGLGSRAPAPPAGVVARKVAFDERIEPARTEWFLAATAPAAEPGQAAQVRLQQPAGQPRIVAPQGGALVAWDPDIPVGVQGIVARHNGAGDALRWVLNGEPAGSAARVVLPLKRGRNVLVLVAADGTVLDEVRYEVRGLPPSAAAAN